jgi:hypothetical protein
MAHVSSTARPPARITSCRRPSCALSSAAAAAAAAAADADADAARDGDGDAAADAEVKAPDGDGGGVPPKVGMPPWPPASCGIPALTRLVRMARSCPGSRGGVRVELGVEIGVGWVCGWG